MGSSYGGLLSSSVRSTNDGVKERYDMNSLFAETLRKLRAEYSLAAWSTGASGFMVKPITVQGVREQLENLRHPFPTGGAAE